MKKVYYIANARMPNEKAHGIQLAKMSEAFVKQGLDLVLLVPNRTSESKSLKNYYGLSEEIKIIRLPCLDFFTHGRFSFWLCSMSFMLFSAFFLLSKKIQGQDFFVYTIDMDQFSFFLLPFLGIAYAAEIHDAKPRGSLYGRFFKKAVGIITINNLIKEKIVRRFSINPRKIVVYPNGLDLDFIKGEKDSVDARRKLNIPNDKKIAVYTGRFVSWKGIEILPEASRLLPANTVIYFVGELGQTLEEKTGRKIPETLICVGSRDYTEIPLWLAAADVLLVVGTKKNEYSLFHTSPMKLFEYMLANRPIVAPDTPAIRQIVDEQEVYFYQPDNPKSLALKISQALGDLSNGNSKGKHLRKKSENFSWDRRAGGVIDFLKLKIWK